MTDAELAAIKARAEAATPGPWCCPGLTHQWVIAQHSDDADDCYETQPRIIEPVDDEHMRAPNPRDLTFIAHAREDVPTLVAEVENLRGFIGEALEMAQRADDRTVRISELMLQNMLGER